MRILLTGATGFLGSHIARMLVGEGHEVVALKRRTSSMARLELLKGKIHTFDIEDRGMQKCFEISVDAVIHMATCYGRRDEPRSSLVDINVLLPLKLLETAFSHGTRLFINTDTALPPQTSDYARSKRQFLEWSRELSSSQNLHFLNMKLEHFYGPGDDGNKFITHLIRACFSDQPIELTPGEQLRDFIHVDDVVSAYRHVLSRAAQGLPLASEYSVGTGVAIPLRDLVALVHRSAHSTAALRFGAVPYREGEPLRSIADIRPLRAIGWAPAVGLEQGLNKTIEKERELC